MELFADMPSLLSVNDIMKALHIGRSTAYTLVHSDKIGKLRIGKQIRIPKTELIAYITENTQK